MLAFAMVASGNASAADWPRFRGPNGSGIPHEAQSPPFEWDGTQNVKWSRTLPGPGSSCPIVVGDRVYVTCWSGYGLNPQQPGDQRDLMRHLLCIDRATGEPLWQRDVEPVLPEDEYAGMFTQHGYASHTPVANGERVFAFFGKSGIWAFDAATGEPLWNRSVGTGSGHGDWGTASSPILYKNLVIVPATAESHALVAFDQQTGDEVWRQQAEGFDATWSTPILVEREDGEQDLVIVVPQEVWGLNPETGRLRWYCRGPQSDTACASVIAADGIVYAIGGRDGGSTAVRVGGAGDVSETHVLWTGDHSVSIGTPVLHEGLIYWFARGVAHCIEASTGSDVYRERLEADSRVLRGRSYSSPVVAGGRLYFVAASGHTFVLALGREFEQLAVNGLVDDASDAAEEEFQSTPAISDGELFIRSSRRLYCVSSAR